MNKTALTIKTYDLIAKYYEKENFRFGGQEELDKFIPLLKPGAKILDAGCGFGRELAYFINQGFDTYGIDGSGELLKLAKKRAPKAKLKLVDLRNKLPYSDNFFDAVWARNSLHHLEPKDLLKALNEIRRILKPKGILFIEWKEGEKAMITKEEIAQGHERYYNLMPNSKLVGIIKNAGFYITNNYTYNWSQRYGEKRQFSDFIVIFAVKP
ncbi:MAG: class I SAM-dependent methyltransferase [Candidatus Levybacteria bacterium]|nr:class I SAM-dependent methyltransferase [Candidatus Levybacteria bacterium]